MTPSTPARNRPAVRCTRAVARRAVVGAALLAVSSGLASVLLAPPSLARGVPAQVVVEPNTTTAGSTSTSTSTSTTAPLVEAYDTSTTSTSTTTTVPVSEDVGEDAATEEPPDLIPELPGAPMPIRNPTLEAALFKLTIAQKKLVAAAQARADAATKRVAAEETKLDELRTRLYKARRRATDLRARHDRTRFLLRERAMRMYTGSQVSSIDQILSARDANDFARRVDLVQQAQKVDQELLLTFRSESRRLKVQIELIDRVTMAQQERFDKLKAEETALAKALGQLQSKLIGITGGQAIALGGFVFPVSLPFNFADTFGAPRMVGTPFEHFHEGTDIFAPSGTPLHAVTRGIVTRVGTDRLGGTKLWLVGADGTAYYYAHLSDYAPGVRDGLIVEAGEVVGFVGNTGNALTTPAHLHFEIHPRNSDAINPFPILDAVRRTDLGSLLAARTSASTTTTLPPGVVRVGIGFRREYAIDVSALPQVGGITRATTMSSTTTTGNTARTSTTTIRRSGVGLPAVGGRATSTTGRPSRTVATVR